MLNSMGISSDIYSSNLERFKDSEAACKQFSAGMIAAKSYDELWSNLQRYVQSKYQLHKEDLALDGFNALGQMSVARSLGRTPTELEMIEMKSKCNGTSPSLTKKLLLFISLKRDIGLKLEPEETPDITKLSELALRICAEFGIDVQNAEQGASGPFESLSS